MFSSCLSCLPIGGKPGQIYPSETISFKEKTDYKEAASYTIESSPKSGGRGGYARFKTLGSKVFSEPGPLTSSSFQYAHLETIPKRTRLFSSSVTSKSKRDAQSDNSDSFPAKLMKSLSVNFLGGKDSDEGLFRDNIVRVYVVTWNMAGKLHDKDSESEVGKLLSPQGCSTPDIIVISTQECERPLSQSWYMPPHSTSSTCPLWSEYLDNLLQPRYSKIASSSLCSTHLSIYIAASYQGMISNVKMDKMALGPGNLVGTKGALAISFKYNKTSFCFINAHLKAGDGMESKNARNEQLYKIQKSLNEIKGCDSRDAGFERVSDRVDVCFFTGDLNTRLHGITRRSALDLIESGKIEALLQYDEMSDLLNGPLKGFKEPSISFKPTFKFDIYSHVYDTSKKQRTPAYTDRIVYSTRSLVQSFSAHRLFGFGLNRRIKGYCEECIVKCLAYSDKRTILCSDHKPVYGLFEISK